MAWKAYNGIEIDMPYALFAKITRTEKPSKDDVMAALEGAQRIYEVAMQLDQRCRELANENQRLKHENAFMIRLIEDREQ